MHPTASAQAPELSETLSYRTLKKYHEWMKNNGWTFKKKKKIKLEFQVSLVCIGFLSSNWELI